MWSRYNLFFQTNRLLVSGPPAPIIPQNSKSYYIPPQLKYLLHIPICLHIQLSYLLNSTSSSMADDGNNQNIKYIVGSKYHQLIYEWINQCILKIRDSFQMSIKIISNNGCSWLCTSTHTFSPFNSQICGAVLFIGRV